MKKIILSLSFLLILISVFFQKLVTPQSVLGADGDCATFTVTPTTDLTTATRFTGTATGCLVAGDYWIRAEDKDGIQVVATLHVFADPDGIVELDFSGFPGTGTYIIQLIYQYDQIAAAPITITIEENLVCGSLVSPGTGECPPGAPGPNCCPKECPAVRCDLAGPQYSCTNPDFICGGSDEPYTEHIHCYVGDGSSDVDEGTINSAIGCIPIETDVGLMRFMIRWAIGIASGIAFLLILYSSFLIMTSSGHPKKIAAGKELLISAITGLILLIFAVWLLRIIGADILGIFQ